MNIPLVPRFVNSCSMERLEEEELEIIVDGWRRPEDKTATSFCQKFFKLFQRKDYLYITSTFIEKRSLDCFARLWRYLGYHKNTHFNAEEKAHLNRIKSIQLARRFMEEHPQIENRHDMRHVMDNHVQGIDDACFEYAWDKTHPQPPTYQQYRPIVNPYSLPIISQPQSQLQPSSSIQLPLKPLLQPPALQQVEQQQLPPVRVVPDDVFLTHLIRLRCNLTKVREALIQEGYTYTAAYQAVGDRNKIDQLVSEELKRNIRGAVPTDRYHAIQGAMLILIPLLHSERAVKNKIIDCGAPEGLVNTVWQNEQERCKQGIRDSFLHALQCHRFDEERAKDDLRKKALFPQFVDQVWGNPRFWTISEEWPRRAQAELNYDPHTQLRFKSCIVAEGGLSHRKLADGSACQSSSIAFAAKFLELIGNRSSISSSHDLATLLNALEDQFRKEPANSFSIDTIKYTYQLISVEPPRLDISQANEVLNAGDQSQLATTSDALGRLWDWLVEQPTRGGILSYGDVNIALARNGDQVQLFDSDSGEAMINQPGAYLLSFDSKPHPSSVIDYCKNQFINAIQKRFPPITHDLSRGQLVPKQCPRVTFTPFLLHQRDPHT